MKLVKPGTPGVIAFLVHRITAAWHGPALDVLGAHRQLRDLAGVRCIANYHPGHAFGVEQLLGLALVLVRVLGIGGIEQGDGAVEALLVLDGHER
jgi:hypothetical protein